MFKAVMFIGTLLLFFSGPAASACMEGQTKECRVGGKAGIQECLSGRWTQCEVYAEPEIPLNGTVIPDFLVLAVIYAPPGRDTQGGGSSVTYGSTSALGSSVSSNTSFKLGYKVTASGEAVGNSIAGTFSWAATTGTESTVKFKKTAGETIKVPGPAKNGIDHGYDQIWLWLRPKIDMALYSDYAAWNFRSGRDDIITYVRVRELIDPSTMTAETARDLQSAGITPDKYKTILAATPFASGNASIDESRYLKWGSVPYKAPLTARDAPTSKSDKFSIEDTAEIVDTGQLELGIGFSVEAGVEFLGLLKSKLKNELSWGFTYTGKVGNSTTTLEEAAYTIDGPTFGYAGPENVIVYYDRLYKSFMFAMTSAAPRMQGRLRSQSGRPVAGKQVTIISGSGRYNTFTDAAGTFSVFAPISGVNQLRVDGVRKRIDGATLRRGVVDVAVP